MPIAPLNVCLGFSGAGTFSLRRNLIFPPYTPRFRSMTARQLRKLDNKGVKQDESTFFLTCVGQIESGQVRALHRDCPA